MNEVKICAPINCCSLTFQESLIPAPPPPTEMDADPETRKKICRELSNSLYFRKLQRDPVNMNKGRTIRKLRQKKKYREIFNEIYEESPNRRTCFTSRPKYNYVNPYRLQTVRVDTRNQSIITRQEHAFVCLLKTRKTKIFVPYYVSKEYNVMAGQISALRIAGRFVFKPPPAHIQLVMLAEEPAQVNESEDFDLEHYYLTLRRDRLPGELC